MRIALFLICKIFTISVCFSQTDSVPDYFQETIQNQKRTIKNKPSHPERHFKTVHKTNPFALIFGNTPYNSELRYMNETVLFRKFTLMLSASYLFKGMALRAIEKIDTLNQGKLSLNGYRIQVGLRFYPINKTIAPRGLWVGPHFSFLNFRVKPKSSHSTSYIDATHLNINLLVGYQFIAGRVCFDLYTGLGYKNNVWIVKDSGGRRRWDELYRAYPFYESPIKLNFGINMGIAF